ncbi:MAG: hypothetical protein V1797_00960, partial [Pseudomonadota bacterium]
MAISELRCRPAGRAWGYLPLLLALALAWGCASTRQEGPSAPPPPPSLSQGQDALALFAAGERQLKAGDQEG